MRAQGMGVCRKYSIHSRFSLAGIVFPFKLTQTELLDFGKISISNEVFEKSIFDLQKR